MENPRRRKRGDYALGYYDAYDGMPIELVLHRWREDRSKAYDRSLPVFYDANDLWKYREYDWTRESARRDPEEWDELHASIKRHGWDEKDPLILQVGPGRAMVGEGNHRLAIAREMDIPVPVTFWFTERDPGLPKRSIKRRVDEQIARERAALDEGRRKRRRERYWDDTGREPPPTDEEMEAQVDEIMDLLDWR